MDIPNTNISTKDEDSKTKQKQQQVDVAVANADDAGEVEPPSDTKDIDYNPILPAVAVKTLEEEEEVLASGRGKLYRYANESDPPEWKERGVGEWRLLRHSPTGRVRFLLRRDKTLKLGANHRVLPTMSLSHHGTGDGAAKTWMWTTAADLSEDTPRKEHFCIRLRTPQLASEFEQAFERAKRLAGDVHSPNKSLNESSTSVTNETNKTNDSISSTPSSKEETQSTGNTAVDGGSSSNTHASAPATDEAPTPSSTATSSETAKGASTNKIDEAVESTGSLAASLEKLAIDKTPVTEKVESGDKS